MANKYTSIHNKTNIDLQITNTLNKVDKTGDTMTGNLQLTDNSILINTKIYDSSLPASDINSAGLFGFTSNDEDSHYVGYFQAQKVASSGDQGIRLSSRRVINSTNYDNNLQLRLDEVGNPIVNVSDNIAWIEGLQIFPVGSVICQYTNSPPSYGTWTLIDKKFKYKYIDTYNPTRNTTNCSAAEAYGFCHGHNIFLAWRWTSKTTINDDEHILFTIDPAKFGLSSFGTARNLTQFSDGGNVIIFYNITSAGVVSVRDVFVRSSSTSLAASFASGVTINTFTCDFSTANPNDMLDSACDKFYFKRTA